MLSLDICLSSCLCKRQCAVVLHPQAEVLLRMAHQDEFETILTCLLVNYCNNTGTLETIVIANAFRHVELQSEVF